MTEPRTLTRPHRTIQAGLLAVWLIGAGGCAQVGFPELPPGLFAKPASEAPSPVTADSAPADAVIAETVEPPPAIEANEPETPPAKLFEWGGDGRELTRIVIDTNEQTAHFYAGDERVGWSTIASGVASHPTPRGEFTILEKVRDKRSNLYGKIVGRNGRVLRGDAHGKEPVPRGARFVGASMPNFMRLTYDGIGMHAGPIPKPGQPASHGCIRMPAPVAAAVFKHASPGTAVTVIGNGPDYGNYAERIARQQAEERARRAAAAAAQEGTALDALDAEIEVLEEAGVDTAPDAGTARRAKPAGAAESPATGTQGAASAEAAADRDTPAPSADATPVGPNAPAPGATRTKTQDAGGQTAAAGEGGAQSAARADASAAAGPSPPLGASSPQSPAGRDAEPTPMPEATPADRGTLDQPRYYGPPAPPPTIRSAEQQPAGVGQV